LGKVLSIIIPTYNERDNIQPLVERLHRVLAGQSYEVIFIDDDSRDGTAEAVREMEKHFPVRVLVRKDKKGLASAVVDGISYAAGDIVAVMDADLQHPPEVIPALLQALENGADVAVASRYVKGGGSVGLGPVRKLVSRGAALIAHIALPETRPVHDPMSGFFMFRKRVVEGVELKPTGYKILLEILVRGKEQKLAEVPFLFALREKGKSKLNFRQQVDYLRHVYSLMQRRRELVRFGKFCLVGGSGVVVNEGILWLLTEFGGLRYYISSIFAIEGSIISNFVLNDYFTFADRRAGKTGSFMFRLLKFNTTCVAGALIQYGLLLLFTSVLGVNYLISNLFGIAAATLWNYLVNVLWTWR